MSDYIRRLPVYLLIDCSGSMHGEKIEAVKQGEYTKVVLEPLMIVAGDHANNDMAGDEDDSWKSLFENEGYEVTCVLKGLGEMEQIRELIAEHTRSAIDTLE